MRSQQNSRVTAYHPPKASATRLTQPPRKRRFIELYPLLTGDFRFITTTVYFLPPPSSLSTSPPWITAATKPDSTTTLRLQHPLTSKPLLSNPPIHLLLPRANYTPIAVSYRTPTPFFNKLLVFCNTLLAIYNSGTLLGCPSYDIRKKEASWVELTHHKFDDIIVFLNEGMYALDRKGNVYDLSITNTTSKTPGNIRIANVLINCQLDFNPGLEPGQIGWRKRLVNDDFYLYLVVRTTEKSFKVYKEGETSGWDEVQGFDDRQVLFMSRDCHFFRKAEEFSGRGYENCIVFSEGAFPKYGIYCWTYSQNPDDVAVFRLSDGIFAREGEGDEFPMINWSSPSWISHCLSESSRQSEREREEDKGLDSNSEDKNDGEMQSDSDSHDQDGDMQCDLISRENEDEQEVTRMSCGHDTTKHETSMKNVTQSLPRACSSCTIKSHKRDSTTSKFEGFVVRTDLIPTLQKIWRNHGNILENSPMRSGDMVARALESLATMVQILEDNSAQSLIGTQADYLSSSLSDLRLMCFKLYWLIPFVEKAVQLHKNKHLLDSFHKLSQLSFQVKKQRVILLDKLAKLNVEENKLEEEMMKVSKRIPFSKKVKFDAPLGSGLT